MSAKCRPVVGSTDESIRAALVSARQRGIPVLVALTGPGCPFCWIMEREVYPDPHVEQELARFVAVRIDSSVEPALAYRYGVEGIPAFLVLSEKGSVMERAMGYQSVDAFMQFLRRGRQAASSREP